MRTTPLISRGLIWFGVCLLTGWELRNARPDPRTALARAGITLIEENVYTTVRTDQATLDVYLPSRSPPSGASPRRPAVLLIHGGSWRGGSKADYRSDPNNTMIRLAQRGLVVIAVDYRLARPGSPSWPVVIENLRDAVRWIRRHASELEIQPDRIVALGQSSGAHLAALLGTLPDEPGTDGVSSRVQAVVSFYGPTDLASLMRARHLDHEPARTLLGNDEIERSQREFVASPIHHVTKDDAPMLLIHGSNDTWVRPEQSTRMAEALERAGVPHRSIVVGGARHGFEAKVNEPVERDLLPEILAFLESVWNVSIGREDPQSPKGR